MTQLRAETLLVVVTVLWAGTFVLVKAALDDISPSGFVLLRFGLASIVGLLLWRKALNAVDWTLLLHGLIIGTLFGLGFVLQSIGLVDTTPTSSAFITGTTVVFVPFVYRIVERRTISALNWFSTIVVAFGLFLFTEPEHAGFRWGDLLTVASAVGWAGYIVALDVFTVSTETSQNRRDALVLMQLIVTTVIAACGIVVFDGAELSITWSSSLIVGVAYCALAATVITTWVQTNVQRFTHPVRAGVIYSLEPIFASIIALSFFDEEWGWRQGAGAFALLAAAIVPDIIAARKDDL